tara:strand:+ start:456 stop:1205 length:750 start_codon:yes stop_codon:yes gene_type:complete
VQHFLISLTFFILFFSEIAGCDPVLESLIFSKSRVETIDLHFREFSSQLSEMGSQWRNNKRFKSSTVVEMKAVWLKIYQGYYFKPPSYFEKVDYWRHQLDKVAFNLKDLGKFVHKELPEVAHQLILQIQSTLVDLYDHSREMSLFQRGKFLEYMIELVYKNRKEYSSNSEMLLASEDYQRLTERVYEDWESMYHQMPVSLKSSWTMDKWKQQLENFLKLKDEEQSKKQVHAFMLKIYEESWKSLERSKP